jgi:hypothetical protein
MGFVHTQPHALPARNPPSTRPSRQRCCKPVSGAPENPRSTAGRWPGGTARWRRAGVPWPPPPALRRAAVRPQRPSSRAQGVRRRPGLQGRAVGADLKVTHYGDRPVSHLQKSHSQKRGACKANAAGQWEVVRCRSKGCIQHRHQHIVLICPAPHRFKRRCRRDRELGCVVRLNPMQQS